MADPTIDWLTKIITVPQSFLIPLGGDRYQLDVNDFRNALKDIEDNTDGMVFSDTHRHSTESVLSGVTYARQFEIINGYTITFEPTGTPYQVECVGANHNILDVKNVNHVSLVIGNSAGLIVTGGGSGGVSESDQVAIANKVWATLTANILTANSIGIHVKDNLLTTGKFLALKD